MNLDLGITAGIGATVAIYATNYVINKIIGLVKSHKEKFYAEMNTKFDHMQDWIAGKYGISIPEGVQGLIFGVVRWIEEHVFTPDMLRKLINYARGRKQDELVSALEGLQGAAKDEILKRIESIPDGKSIFNSFKKEEAEKIVTASLRLKQPTLKVEHNNVISETIDAAATACKVELPNTNPIRKPDTQALVEELRAKLQMAETAK